MSKKGPTEQAEQPNTGTTEGGTKKKRGNGTKELKNTGAHVCKIKGRGEGTHKVCTLLWKLPGVFSASRATKSMFSQPGTSPKYFRYRKSTGTWAKGL